MRSGIICWLGAACWVVFSLSACAFDTEGASGSGVDSLGNATESQGTGDTTGDTEDSVGPPSTTKDSGAATTSGSTTDVMPSDSSESGMVDPTTGPTDDEAAFLTFSVAEAVFPDAQNTETTHLEIIVTNEGAQAAIAIAAGVLTGQFHFVSGFPGGAAADCGNSLEAGDSCTVVISNSPTTIGLRAGDFSVRYYDGIVSRATGEIPVRAAVHGTTVNLLENPSAAGGVLEPWARVSGIDPGWVAGADLTAEEAFSFRPIGSTFTNRALRQQVTTQPFADVIANAPLRYSVTLKAKRTQSNRTYSAWIQVDGTSWVEVGTGQETSWADLSVEGSLAVGAPLPMTLEFRCEVSGWQSCGTSFDAASLTLSYP